MNFPGLPLLVFLLSLFQLPTINATNYISNGNGDWTEPTTWFPNGIPGENDHVILYDSIYVDSKIKVASITMVNTTNHAILYINSTDTLEVTGDFSATAQNQTNDLDIQVRKTATFIVNGNFTMTRSSDNDTANKLRYYQFGSSKAYILGDLNFYYQGSNDLEEHVDLFIGGSATFDVTGKTNFSVTGGNIFSLRAMENSQVVFRDSIGLSISNGGKGRIVSESNAHIQLLKNAKILNSGGINGLLRTGSVGGSITLSQNLYLESEVSGDWIKVLVANDTSEIKIRGDVIMDAVGDDDIGIAVDAGSFHLGGDIIRNTAYGYLSMGDEANFVFDGTTPQQIPEGNLVNSGIDSLYFGKVSFENSSGSPITLSEDLIVNDTLFLTTGNIVSSNSAKVVLEDNAVISGGNEMGYVEGPVLKKGRSNGLDLFLPIGSSDLYSPISLSAIGNSSTEITVAFKGDPPPFGGVPLGVDTSLISNGYWEVTKKADIENPDIILHWDDAAAMGIQDLDDLFVAGSNSSNTWVSYGNGGTTGGTGDGVSGSVSSIPGDPPPFGVFKFTIGSTTPDNSLPVELIRFDAAKHDAEVYLQWETATEENSSHFVVQRSDDGHVFEDMHTILTNGNSETRQQYSSEDTKPYYGLNYYRLKIVDNDRTTEYSNIEVVKFELIPTIALYPNPVNDVLNVSMEDALNMENILEVFDRSGRMIYSGKVRFEGGLLQITAAEINANIPGPYFLRIGGQKESKVIKFIKLK